MNTPYQNYLANLNAQFAVIFNAPSLDFCALTNRELETLEAQTEDTIHMLRLIKANTRAALLLKKAHKETNVIYL